MSRLIEKFARLRERARAVLEKGTFEYIDGGADDEVTLQSNREAWRRLKLIPRVWTGDSLPVDTSCTLFGRFHFTESTEQDECIRSEACGSFVDCTDGDAWMGA